MSDYLVAIITKDGLSSASVHEEIGYAIGKDIPVILMVDEKVKEVKGVLIHGKEEYYFSRDFFRIEAEDIAKYIKDNGISKSKSKPIARVANTTSRYLKYDPQQKLKHVESDVLSAFEEHKFTRKTLRISRRQHLQYPDETELIINVAEDKKRHQRYFIFVHNDSLTHEKLGQIYSDISYYVFPILRHSHSWLNMACVATIGSANKQTIAKYYERPNVYGRGTLQNTTVPLDNSVIYYGLGEVGSLRTHKLESWNYRSSMPKFFIYNVKSKDDLALRIGNAMSFIKDNKGIFRNVPRLVEWSKKYNPRKDEAKITVKVLP